MFEGKNVRTGACHREYKKNINKCENNKEFYLFKPTKSGLNYENIKKRNKNRSKLNIFRNLYRFKENNYIDYNITYSNPIYGNG